MTDVQREPYDASHALEPTTEHGTHSHAEHADHWAMRRCSAAGSGGACC